MAEQQATYGIWRAFIDSLREIDDAVLNGEKTVMMVFLSAMVLGVFSESMLRWLFDHGIPGVSEGARFMMVVVGFLGASVATAERKHLVVDILAKALAGRDRLVGALAGLAYLASMLLIGFLVWSSAVYLDSPGVQGRVSNAIGLPLGTVVSMMVFSLAVMEARFGLICLEEFSIALGLLPVSYRRESEGLSALIEGAE